MFITYWLQPDVQYKARQAGKLVTKTNRQFCEEVTSQIRKSKSHGAEIQENMRGEIAVCSFSRDAFPYNIKSSSL